MISLILVGLIFLFSLPLQMLCLILGVLFVYLRDAFKAGMKEAS